MDDNLLAIILDGSKITWTNYPSESAGVTRTVHHIAFPHGGRPPRKIYVRSHRTGAVVPFAFVNVAEDEEGSQAVNYMATLADGRHISLAMLAG
jgi:hypothetical protein